MYAPGYGYHVPNVPPTFNNAAPPPNQNPHMQQGSVPTQPGQQMMYNPNQFAGMSGGQPGFVAGPNPAMMSGAGPAGMMQNAGMPHMAANGQMAFQNPYQGNPYGGNMPSPGGQHPNFGGMQGFPMGGNMTPQQQVMMQQRMQAQQQAQHQAQQGQANASGMPLGSTPQRPMSAAQGGHGSPNNAMSHQQHQQQQHPQQQHQPQQQQQQGQPQQQHPQQPHPQGQQTQQLHPQQQQHAQQQQHQHQQSQQQQQQQQQQQPQQAQFSNPQAPSHGHTPSTSGPQQQHVAASVTTPQTPTFPSHNQNASVNGNTTVSTPLSPGSESREQERFSVLLEINQELLFESMQLQHTLSELKKEAGEGEQARKPSPEETAVQQDYGHCMRRLQANLAYLAALADRKGNVHVPPSPAYISPPPLNMTLKVRLQTPPGDTPENNPDPMTDRHDRTTYLVELYTKLQSLFPNVDPKKEPAFPAPTRPQGQPGMGQGQRAQGHQASPGMAQAQRPMQMQNMQGAH